MRGSNPSEIDVANDYCSANNVELYKKKLVKKKQVLTVNSRYLEHRATSNKTLGPFSTNSSGVTTRYLELPAELFTRFPESPR